VFSPQPRDGADNLQYDGIMLKWVPSRNAISHIVYFGKNNLPELKGNQKENYFRPGLLESKTNYSWRIDEVMEADTLHGTLWHFTTK